MVNGGPKLRSEVLLDDASVVHLVVRFDIDIVVDLALDDLAEDLGVLALNGGHDQ
jgi:hypothetical protein